LDFDLVKALLYYLTEINGGDLGEYSQVQELQIKLEGKIAQLPE